MVEWAALEMQYIRKSIGGSNPPASAYVEYPIFMMGLFYIRRGVSKLLSRCEDSNDGACASSNEHSESVPKPIVCDGIQLS